MARVREIIPHGMVLRGEATPRWTQWLRNGDVTTRNSSLWKTNPAQQLGYRQAVYWARQYAPGAILGVARVVGLADPSAPWHFGAEYAGKPNVGWLLDDVVAFDAPVLGPGGAPITGALGCWRLPEDVRLAVLAAHAAATRGRP